MSSTQRLVAAALAVAAVAFSACGGDSKTVVRTTEPGDAVPAVTGIVEVDRIIAAVQRGDTVKLAELTGYSTRACVKRPASPRKFDDPPECAPDEDAGASVEAMPATGCEGGWARPTQAVATYEEALAGGAQVIAAYVPRPEAGSFGERLHEQYVVVARAGDAASGAEVALHLTGGRISWLEKACPADADLAASQRVQTMLFPAVTPAASPSATP